jgi:hypothetical protein
MALETDAREPAMARDGLVDPDEEALRLVVKLANRLQVARSFARLTAGVLQERAARASEVLKVYSEVAKVQLAPSEAALRARVDHVQRVARAAAEAAVQVTTAETRRYAGAVDELARRARDAAAAGPSPEAARPESAAPAEAAPAPTDPAGT